jgi:serine phosphatase RsbU (regulator of sigma subunit)
MKKLIPLNVLTENEKFFNLTQRAFTLGLIAHVSIIPLFWYFEIQEMMLFNVIVSVPVFICVLIFNRRGNHNLAFTLAFFEMIVHQIMGVYFMGWAGGWQYWLITLAGLAFFNIYWKRIIHFIILSTIVLIYVVLYMFFYHGMYDIPAVELIIVYCVNASVVLITLSIYINYYTKSAHKSEEKLKSLNSELIGKNEKIEKQRESILQSINYAERIQSAVIPDKRILDDYFKESFILYYPKDIVSGDFYWVSDVEDKLVVVCADCTGHGVPGGFMSMLGMSFLNEIVNNRHIFNAHTILEEMRTKVKDTLKQNKEGDQPKDGMDMSVCVFEKTMRKLYFSGANNGIYLMRNNELVDYKPIKNPIGIYLKEIPFEEHEVELKANDRIYMFTDGYIDQFGGDNHKKFYQKRLKQHLSETAEYRMDDQFLHLDKTFYDWKGEYPQTDDCTLIGLHIP